MKNSIALVLGLSLLVPLVSEGLRAVTQAAPRDQAGATDDPRVAQPKLLTITARVDGTGRLIFTRRDVRYERRTWSPPSNVVFGGEPWTDLDRTPAVWREMVDHLDLTGTRIVRRRTRDVVALESTADGFDLYLCDALDGASPVEVTLAIPRRD